MPTRGGRHRPKLRMIMSKDWSLRATLQPIYAGGQKCVEVILWTKYDQDTGQWKRLRRWVLYIEMERAIAAVEKVLNTEQQAPSSEHPSKE